MGNRKKYWSETELINYLKKSSLISILVEGRDDADIYRILEQKYNNINESEEIDILPCQGRPVLLNIFNRRHEFPNTKVIFIADQDMWLFTGIPPEYQEHIIFTKGYSIENDLYLKEQFESLLEKEETAKFELLIENLSHWFAGEVEKHIRTGSSNCGLYINQICCRQNQILLDCHEQYLNENPVNNELTQSIKNEFHIKIRGKNIFQALIRFLSAEKRRPKYSYHHLYEMGAKFSNTNIEELAQAIKYKIYQNT